MKFSLSYSTLAFCLIPLLAPAGESPQVTLGGEDCNFVFRRVD